MTLVVFVVLVVFQHACDYLYIRIIVLFAFLRNSCKHHMVLVSIFVKYTLSESMAHVVCRPDDIRCYPKSPRWHYGISRWRHQMETFSALLVLCEGNSPVTGEFPAQRPVTRSLDVFFDLCPNKLLSKQSWGWWLETPSRPLWRHPNVSKSSRWHTRHDISWIRYVIRMTYAPILKSYGWNSRFYTFSRWPLSAFVSSAS